jgi:TonB family protein
VKSSNNQLNSDIISAMLRFLSAFVLSIGLASGQTGFPPDVFRVGPDVTAPKVTRQIEPHYSPEARAAEIQGEILFSLVVDEQGQATNIRALNPLGFGLDELALEAIRTWRFQPGVKDGKPVKVGGTIEIHFGLKGRLKTSESRTQLKSALQHLKGDSKSREQALKTIQDLTQKKFPEAMYAYAQLLAAGKELPLDSGRSRELMSSAADAKYGPALFAVASSAAEQGQAKDLESTKEAIRNAAVLGSTDAQQYMAVAYEKGNAELGFQQDDERSLYYYRLCAAAGQMRCQFKLGELLLNTRKREELDIAESIAWLELSADQGEVRARTAGPQERASLSPEQIARVATLKQKLVHQGLVN